MQFKWATGTNNQVYQDALSIRRKVFIEEQHVDETIEIDGTDNTKHHVVGYLDNIPQATARINPLGPRNSENPTCCRSSNTARFGFRSTINERNRKLGAHK